MEEQAGSSPLFAVFVLSLFSLFLIPYTIYKLCVAAAPDEVVKPWESVSLAFLALLDRYYISNSWGRPDQCKILLVR